MKKTSFAIQLLFFTALFISAGLLFGTESYSSEIVLAPPAKKLDLWDFVVQASIEDNRERKTDGISYLVGGAAAIAFPYIFTQNGNPLRDVTTFILVPVGVYSMAVGGYTLLTDSPWVKIKKRVEGLAGPNDGSDQWLMRREEHAREALLERAESARFWRFFWGGLQGGAGIALVTISQSPVAVVTSGTFIGMSLYNFLYKRAEERFAEQLDLPALGFSPRGDALMSYTLYF